MRQTPRKTRRQSLIPRVKEEEPLKVSELKAFWNKKCKEAEEELENKDLPPLPVEEVEEDVVEAKEDIVEAPVPQEEIKEEEIETLQVEEPRFSSLPFAALFKGILALAFLSGLAYLFLSTSIPSLVAQEAYVRIEQVGKLVREQVRYSILLFEETILMICQNTDGYP